MLDRVYDSQAWRASLAAYAYVMSGGSWRPWKYLVYMASELENAIRRGNGRLIFNLPSRHGKSELISRWLPIWFLDLFPDRRVILATTSSDLANDLGRFVRDTLMHHELSITKPRRDARSVSAWKTEEGGGMYCVGVTGSIIGRGGDLLIIDDPHKSWQEALSVTHCSRIYDWFTSTFYHRREPRATIVINQTRWNEYDLTGQVLQNQTHERWKHICFPFVAEEDDLLGRKIGEVLCPERFPQSEVGIIKQTMGRAYDAIYQQRPVALEGNIIKAEWLNFYDTLPEDLEFFIQSWDLTFVKTGTSKVCGMVWAYQPNTNAKYLVDMIHKKMSFVETQEAVKLLLNRWPQTKKQVIIENKANGPALISQMKKDIPGLVPFEPRGDKDSRFSAVAPEFMSGNIFIPNADRCDWVKGLVTEWVNIPNYPDRDRTDATSQALLYYNNKLKQRNVFDLDISALSSASQKSPWEFGYVNN